MDVEMETQDGPHAEASSSRQSGGGSYHFYGLVDTQTQGLPDEDDDLVFKTDSQKENMHAVQPSPPPTPKPRHNARKPLTIQSPRHSQPQRPPSSRYRRSTRKRSLSQDSFAGPIYEDPEKEFLANKRTKLDIPIEELELSGEELSEEQEEPMRARDLRNPDGSFVSPGLGRILVDDSSPENSSQSQSQSRSQHQGGQTDDSFAEIYASKDSEPSIAAPELNATQNSESAYASSAPSSDYVRFGEPPSQPEEDEKEEQVQQEAKKGTIDVDHDKIVPVGYGEMLPDDCEPTQPSFPHPPLPGRDRRALTTPKPAQTTHNPAPWEQPARRPEPVRKKSTELIITNLLAEGSSRDPMSIPTPPQDGSDDPAAEADTSDNEQEPIPVKPNKGKGAAVPKAAPRSSRVDHEDLAQEADTYDNEQEPVKPNKGKGKAVAKAAPRSSRVDHDDLAAEADTSDNEQEPVKPNKGKGKAAAKAPPRSSKAKPEEPKSIPVPNELPLAQSSKNKRPLTKPKPDLEPVPSSVPGEKSIPPARPKTRGATSQATKTRGRAAKPAARSTAGRRGVKKEFVKEEDEEVPESEDEASDFAETPASNRKRRLPATESHPVSSNKRQKRAVTVTATATVPTSVASARSNFVMKDVRVWGHWRQNGRFYSGTIIAQALGGRFIVRFDDEQVTDLALDDLRKHELRPGDEVWEKSKYVVDHLPEDDSDVVAAVGPKNVMKRLLISKVWIPFEIIDAKWGDRVFETRGHSIVSTRSTVPTAKVLSGYGILITHFDGAEDADDSGCDNAVEPLSKDQLGQQIQEHGGTVVEFEGILELKSRNIDLEHSRFRRADRKWVGKRDISKLFLISDRCSATSKYLTAIAMGIPCLKTRWVTDTIERGVVQQWQSYLLPQGKSLHLGTRVSQFVDYGWTSKGDCSARVLDNPITTKLFDQKEILFVGVKKTMSDTLARIILGMGAETVVSALSISPGDWTNYDIVIFQDNLEMPPRRSTAKSMLWATVKDSLISGRALWDIAS